MIEETTLRHRLILPAIPLIHILNHIELSIEFIEPPYTIHITHNNMIVILVNHHTA